VTRRSETGDAGFLPPYFKPCTQTSRVPTGDVSKRKRRSTWRLPRLKSRPAAPQARWIRTAVPHLP